LALDFAAGLFFIKEASDLKQNSKVGLLLADTDSDSDSDSECNDTQMATAPPASAATFAGSNRFLCVDISFLS
jgi:hypothetical protein